jgi:hypothetical protein
MNSGEEQNLEMLVITFQLKILITSTFPKHNKSSFKTVILLFSIATEHGHVPVAIDMHMRMMLSARAVPRTTGANKVSSVWESEEDSHLVVRQ